MVLSIGGHNIKLSGEDSLQTAMNLYGIKPFLTDSTDCDMHIFFDADFEKPDCRILHQFSIVDDTSTCQFGINTEGMYYYIFNSESYIRFDSKKPSFTYISSISDPNVLNFAIWAAYSMMGLFAKSLPIHASAVVNKGKTVLCLGESGTGKSTHTKQWLQHIKGSVLLNDDSPIVSLIDGNVHVFGSPWSGKTPCYNPISYPAAAFVRIEQKRRNTINKLSAIEAFAAFQPSCPPALTKDERCMDLLVDLISKIITTTPIYRLGCLPNADAARLCYNTIYESK